MKFAEIAPELVVKLILTCSMPAEGMKMMNGEVECKTPETLKQLPPIAGMLAIMELNNVD